MSLTRYLASVWQRLTGKTAAEKTTAAPAAAPAKTASVIAQLRAQVSSKLAAQPAKKGYVYVNIKGTVPREVLEAFADELRQSLKNRIPAVNTNVGGDMTVVQIKWPVSESFSGTHHTTMA